MIVLEDVQKTYAHGEVSTIALQQTSVTIAHGELVCVAGPSGSGKTTLLNLIAGIDRPTRGSVTIDGMPISDLSPTAAALFRRKKLGFVFQDFNLIPVLTAFENVEYTLLLQGVARGERTARVRQVLASVDLAALASRRPTELSGGQQQRVAVARAVIGNPAVVLADEPTGSLDSHTGKDLMQLLQQINREAGTTMVFSSHDPLVIKAAHRVIRLQDGAICSDERITG